MKHEPFNIKIAEKINVPEGLSEAEIYRELAKAGASAARKSLAVAWFVLAIEAGLLVMNVWNIMSVWSEGVEPVARAILSVAFGAVVVILLHAMHATFMIQIPMRTALLGRWLATVKKYAVDSNSEADVK